MPPRRALLSYLPAVAVISLVYYYGSAHPGGVAFLTRDPAYTAKMSPWLGVVSNLGLLLWAATAAICWFAAHTGTRAFSGLLKAGGALTLLLLVDDMLQLHEVFFWRFDWLFYLVYAVLAFLLVAVHWTTISESHYATLAAAAVFFAASILTDVVRLETSFWIFFEDAVKLLGQTSWALYFIGLASDARPVGLAAAPSPPAALELDQVRSELLIFLSQKFNQGEPVQLDTPLLDNLFHDSLAILEILMFLEQSFDISLEQSDLDRFEDVASIIELVQEKR